MTNPARKWAAVEAEMHSPTMTAQLIRFNHPEPLDRVLRDDSYWLDLAVTPRPRHLRGCYLDHWSPHRFERIGKIFLVPPGKTLHLRGDTGVTQISIVCRFRPQSLESVFGQDFPWLDRTLETSLNLQSDNVLGLMQQLAQEGRYPGLASDRLVDLVASQLVIELGRYFTRVNEIPSSSGLSPWRLKLIDERLREIREPPTLAELAYLCKLSVRQLTHGFRASRGCSIGHYVTNKRIGHAKHLLSTDQPVKDIALALGFASSSSFCQAFRRVTGVTPREFRQRALRLIQ